MQPAIVEFSSFEDSIPEALDAIKADDEIESQQAILIKPNLINSSPPPITTPVDCCEAVIKYIRKHSDASIVIGEGCGDSVRDTPEIFEIHGYVAMADRYGIPLIDLNYAPTKRLEDSSCEIFPEFHLPEIALTHYLISLPVLKAHSLADITCSMKNLLGLAPPKHYQRGGHWKKSFFHENMHESIVELCRYRSPDLSIVDASIGMAEYHLGGPECDPPVNKIIVGYDAREVDRIGAELLGLDWNEIGHLV